MAQTFEEIRAVRRLLDTEWGRTHLYFGVVKSQNENKNQQAQEESDNAEKQP